MSSTRWKLKGAALPFNICALGDWHRLAAARRSTFMKCAPISNSLVTDHFSRASLFAFYHRCCFAIDCRVIRPARLQIKFIDYDLHQRGGGDSEKNSEQPEHRRGRQRKEQDVDRMQPHFFAENARHKKIQFDLINHHDHAESQPEFCRDQYSSPSHSSDPLGSKVC